MKSQLLEDVLESTIAWGRGHPDRERCGQDDRLSIVNATN